MKAAPAKFFQQRRAAGVLPWPLPALLAWTIGWVLWAGARHLEAPPLLAGLLPLAAVALMAWRVQGAWRRLIVLAGVPAALVATGTSVPPVVWLAAALLLLAAYPMRAWRDAPLFPTPPHALRELAAALPLADRARVLDAGCGLGAGLRALRAAWPHACLEGVEWSALLAWACRRRCRFAAVYRGDLWRHDWSGCDVVYLFQRPESMARAWDKACREMDGGRWLVSLEFEVPGVAAAMRLDAGDGRPLWVYRVPARAAARSTGRRSGR